jgi:hypothetical protein
VELPYQNGKKTRRFPKAGLTIGAFRADRGPGGPDDETARRLNQACEARADQLRSA